ncbi:MAG: hypothetical protein GF401_19915 [Chitinivibrionales bacterium]|nr:hypothetical protein [Chitinivibrionales bacterium]
MTRWIITIPPDGAARSAGRETATAFTTLLGENRVKIFDTKQYSNAFKGILKNPDENLSVDLVNQLLIVQCLDFEATHLLVPAFSPVTLFAATLLKKQGITTIHWFYEDYRVADYWKNIIEGYDYFLAIQKGEIKDACSRYNVHYEFLPTAATGPLGAPLPQTDKIHDIAFVGFPSEYRIRFLEHCAEKGIDCVIGGKGWSSYSGPLSRCVVKGSWVDAEEHRSIICSAKIGLNLSISSPEQAPLDAHISPRVFDIMTAGAVLLTEDVPLAADVLEKYDYYTFFSSDDAVARIQEITKKEWSSFDRILRSNKQKVADHDTYLNRAGRIGEITE